MASEPSRDAITGEKIASTAVPAVTPPQRNAFTALMSPTTTTTITNPSLPHRKPKQPSSSTPPTDPTTKTTYLGRDGLGAYIASPESFPSSRVIYHTPSFVAINDLFPKSSIHLLLLPRNKTKKLLHPFDALSTDAEFLASVRAETEKLRSLAAKELKRKFGKYSRLDQLRDAAIDKAESGEEGAGGSWPEGRDWEKEIMAGVHAGPSMNHLHVHVMSRDMQSECMRHRKHYNSFNTPFLVGLEDFPIERRGERWRVAKEGSLDGELVCWRCGMGFGNRFKRLKEHLEEEFVAWRGE